MGWHARGRAELSCSRGEEGTTAMAGEGEREEMAGELREGGSAEGPAQVVRVRRDLLAACMTCPLCHKLLRDATTISECLHTFCRKCIYEKLADEESDCCPICHIDLGCAPLEKLRPDHSLQDLRAKIFPFKRRKVEAPEVGPSFSLPARRKERSLSSLVVKPPRIARRTGFTGRRTKAVARRAASLRRRSPVIDESTEREDADAEGHGRNSSSPETITKMSQSRRQSLSNAEPSNYSLNKDTDNGGECFQDKAELLKPLNCLVEAANRMKALKSSPQGPSVKAEANNGPDSEVHDHKIKVREHPNKPKAQDDKNGGISMTPAMVRARKMNGINRRRRVRGTSVQALVDAAGAKREKRTGPIWFSLVAAFNQEGDAPLPQISSCYLRIKDGNLPVSFIKKYLVKKLNLASEAEVELTCRGQPVSPTLALHSLVDLWLQAGTSDRVQASVGTSAKDFMMVLSYGRKVPAS